MESYKNLSGKSGILAYQISDSHIIVQFREGRETFYKYTHASAGDFVVKHMKSLAQLGHGLNSYISIHKPVYEAKGSALFSVE